MTPAVDQELPEPIAPPDSPFESRELARDIRRRQKAPDIEISRLPQQLSDELIAPRPGRRDGDPQLRDRYVLVPEEVRTQIASRHVRREPAHPPRIAHRAP